MFDFSRGVSNFALTGGKARMLACRQTPGTRAFTAAFASGASAAMAAKGKFHPVCRLPVGRQVRHGRRSGCNQKNDAYTQDNGFETVREPLGDLWGLPQVLPPP